MDPRGSSKAAVGIGYTQPAEATKGCSGGAAASLAQSVAKTVGVLAQVRPRRGAPLWAYGPGDSDAVGDRPRQHVDCYLYAAQNTIKQVVSVA
jgi:hypothetical protein